MIYGIRNTATGQVEQSLEGKKAEAKKLADALNDQSVVHEGEDVTFDVVKLDDDGVPVEE